MSGVETANSIFVQATTQFLEYKKNNDKGKEQGPQRSETVLTEQKLREVVAEQLENKGENAKLDLIILSSFRDDPVTFMQAASMPGKWTWNEYVESIRTWHPGDMLCVAIIAQFLKLYIALDVRENQTSQQVLLFKPLNAIDQTKKIKISVEHWSHTEEGVIHVEVSPILNIRKQDDASGNENSFCHDIMFQHGINTSWNKLYSQIFSRNFHLMKNMRQQAEVRIDCNRFSHCQDEIERMQTNHVKKEIKLKDHQIQGVKFALSHLSHTGAEGDKFISRGCLLAHSMGAGKTIQTFFVMKFLQDTFGKFMVNFVIVCPSAMLGEWKNNIVLFHADASDVTFINTNGVLFADPLDQEKKPRIALLTPEALIEQYRDEDSVVRQMFSNDLSMKCLVIFDEAHKIKNPKSRINNTIQTIHQESRANFLFLTGTPLQNCLGELFVICDNLILDDGGHKDKIIMGQVQTQARELLKQITDATAGINDAFLRNMHRKVIDAVQESLVFWVDRVSPAVVEQKLTVNKRQFNVFFKLKNQGILHETLDRKNKNKDYIYTAIQSWQDENTSKPDFLRKLIEDMDNIPHQKAIFMFINTDVGRKTEEIIQSTAAGKKNAVRFVNGATTVSNRQKTFDEFNDTQHELRYLVIQEEVGGVGVNLQYGGNVLVFLQGVSFNPSITQQAIARIYRMGQTRECYILNLITYTSLEMAKLEINRTKKSLSDAILDLVVAPDDTEDTKEGSDTTKPNLTSHELKNLDDFRKKYQADFDGGKLPGRIEDEWKQFQPSSTLQSPTQGPLDLIPTILASVQDSKLQHYVKIELDVEHSTRLQTDRVSVKKEFALERFTTTKTGEKQEDPATKYILELSKTGNVVKLLTNIQEMLFARVYYCEFTGLYVSNDALGLDPPLFWPGKPMPYMDVLVPKYATSQNVQAFLSDTDLAQRKYAKYPKIKFLTKAGNGLTSNPTQQQLIDNVQFCLHYPVRSNAEINKKVAMEEIRVYFQLMLGTEIEKALIFAIPKDFYLKFANATKKSKKYIKVSGKKIGQVKLRHVMKAHQISTTTNRQRLENTMVLLTKEKKPIKTLNSTDPVFEVDVLDESDTKPATTSHILHNLHQKNFLAVFACTTTQEEPEQKTALFVKDHFAWWGSEYGTLSRFDQPQGRLKSVFVYIPDPIQVPMNLPRKFTWQYSEQQVLVSVDYDPEKTNYKVCLANTQNLSNAQDLKTEMLPDATYFCSTNANVLTVKKFLFDYFTSFFKDKLGLEMLNSSTLEFKVENSNDEAGNKNPSQKQGKKARKANKITVLYDRSTIKLRAKFEVYETPQNGEIEFALMDQVSTVTNNAEASARLSNLKLKEIDGKQVKVQAKSQLVTVLKPSFRLQDSTDAIFAFEQKAVSMPKKQTIEYWTEVETDDDSIEFKEETSDALTKADVTTMQLKINKDKKYKTTRLSFLSPLSEAESEATIKKWISWQYQTRLNIDARYMSVVVERKETGDTFECKAVMIRMVVTGMSHAYEDNNVNLLDSIIPFVKLLGKGYLVRSVYGQPLPLQTTITKKTTFLEVLEENRPLARAQGASFGVENKTGQGKKATSNTNQPHPQVPAMDVASHDAQQGPWVVDIDEPLPLLRPDQRAQNQGQSSRPYPPAPNPAKTPHPPAPNPAKTSQPNTVFIISSDSEDEDPPTVIDLNGSPENSPRAPVKNNPPQSQKSTETTPAARPNVPKQAVLQDRPHAQGPAQKTTGGGPGAGKEAVPQATHKAYQPELSSDADDSDSDDDIFAVPRKKMG